MDSDVYDCFDADGQWYVLRVWGVTEETNHAMTLSRNGEELEIFHLDDVRNILNKYVITDILYNNQEIECDRQGILHSSKQLKAENIGYIRYCAGQHIYL